MPTRSEPVNHTVDMTKVGKVIRKLHDQVCQDKRRVEITRAGCDDVCIMISRKELESLEQAMAIFADTTAFDDMCRQMKQVLQSAGMVYGDPAEAEA